MNMREKYYLMFPDGSTLFELPYPADFCYHCLIKLIDHPNELYRQLQLVRLQPTALTLQLNPISLSACDGSELTLQLNLGG